jgi:hypothetical protein
MNGRKGRKGRERTPGMGMITSPCTCETHANANCPLVHPFAFATASKASTNLKLFSQCSSVMRGNIPLPRMSPSVLKSEGERKRPVRMPEPRGE